MMEAENILKQILTDVAKEQEFEDYKTNLKLIQSDGANYTSQLYSVTLSAPEKDDLKLFAKVAAIGEKFRAVTQLQIFETEIHFYTKIFPKYQEFEKRYKIPKENLLVLPKYYGGSAEPMKETLVLEDLSVKGYQPFDRFQCFDWEYASQCVKVLARLHALSVACMREEPEFMANITQESEIQMPDEMKTVLENAVANALKVTAEEHREKLTKFFEEKMSTEGFMAFYNSKRKIVLNHGDFRPSNVLHRRDTNGQLQIVPIDYQIVQKNNPVIDLVYFLVCGSDEEFRQKHKDQYFDRYYEEFSVTLRTLEIYPDGVYTRKDFDTDVETLLPFGLVLGAMALPIVTVDVASAPRLEEGIEFGSLVVETNNLFQTRFNGLVNDYVKWGHLGPKQTPPRQKPRTSPCCQIL